MSDGENTHIICTYGVWYKYQMYGGDVCVCMYKNIFELHMIYNIIYCRYTHI